MRKNRVILGAMFLLLIIIGGIVVFSMMGNTLDKESKAFVDSAVPAIVTDWDIKELQKRASPEFNETVDYRELEQFFEVLHELGDLEEYRGSTGESRIAISFHGIIITALYDATADFESGSAEIELALVKHDGQWQILGFRIKPEEPGERKDII